MNYLYHLRHLATVLLLSACAATTNVDYRPDYDFSAIRTLALEAPGQTGSHDPRISGPLIDARVNASITQVLSARGYHLVEQDANARLTWQLVTKAGLESDYSGIPVGYGHYGSYYGTGVAYGFPFYDIESYDEAVLTIDILSGADGDLLWRGSASRRLGDGLTPEKLTRLVNDLVTEVLVLFPPGSHR
jgi:hypothetical protein